jgi:autotransporter-associated beta strand protein
LDLNNFNETVGSIASSSGTATLALGSGTITTGGNNTSTTFVGDITGNGNLVKTGSGTLTLQGSYSYTGSTTINGGTLSVNQINGQGTSYAISNGATLQHYGTISESTSRPLDLGAGGGTIALTNGIVLTWNGLISGAGGLTKDGPGVLVLANTSNNYAGSTDIGNGILRLGATEVIPSNSAVTVGSGTTLDMNQRPETIGSLAGNGSIINNNAALFTGGNNASTTFSGTISGGGNLVKDGAGTMMLTGSNSYSGNTNIQGGTLSGDTIANAGTNSAFGSGSAIHISNGATLEYAGTATAQTNRTIFVDSGGGVVSISSAAASLTLTNNMHGAGSLTKTGPGTLIFSVLQSHTGGTIVNDGTLLVNNASGSGTGTGDVLVNGGTLGGSGSIAGSVTVNGGSVAPGNSPGVLTIGGDFILAAGSYDYEIDSDVPTADLTNVTFDLSIAPGVTLAISDLGSSLLAMGTKFTLINYGGTWDGGTFAGLANYSTTLTVGQNRFAIRYDDTTGGINFGGGSLGGGSSYVTITAVPEAGALVTMGLVFLCVIAAVQIAKRRGIALPKI